MFSRFLLCLVCFLIDRNESRQLNINRTIATNVISSIAVCWDFPNTFNDVKRRKQIPNRFDDVFKMCGDLSILIIEKFDDVSHQYFCFAFLFMGLHTTSAVNSIAEVERFPYDIFCPSVLLVCIFFSEELRGGKPRPLRQAVSCYLKWKDRCQ